MQNVRVLIVGAGGQAQSAADALLSLHEEGKPVVPIGFVDDNPALAGKHYFGLPVLGQLEQIPHIAHDEVIVSIGSNRMRRLVYERLLVAGERFASVVHPSVLLLRGVDVGQGTYIGAGAVVSIITSIGINTIINGTGCVGHHVTIGDHVHIAPGVTIAGDVHIGSGTMVGIGANILPGVRVGKNCIVGAGSLVREDVPDGATVIGIPARLRIQQ